MRDILWRTEDTRDGYQERLLGSLNELAVVEPRGLDGNPSAIWEAFDYWKSLPTVTSLPNTNHFDQRRLSDYSALPGCAASMVDVRASDPMNFIFSDTRDISILVIRLIHVTKGNRLAYTH